jgi:HEPN domain-containing protein
MSQTQDNNHGVPGQSNEDDLEKQILEGLSLTSPSINPPGTHDDPLLDDEEEEQVSHKLGEDVQGALGLFAEAAQDMATAGVELGLGRHFACADYCNQVAEKAAQSVSLLRFGRRIAYDHDLRSLGSRVDAPPNILHEMERLTPFHPEAFYADTPPEEADDVINAEQARSYMHSARKVLNWARSIVLRT